MKRIWKVHLIVTLAAFMAFAGVLATSQEAVADPGYWWAKLSLENKDSTWDVIDDDGTYGALFYKEAGPTFKYWFFACGLDAITEYRLIYYADKPDVFVNWGGNYPGALIATGTTSGSGRLFLCGSKELNMDLPSPPDINYPDGAKIWLVPSSDYDEDMAKVTTWNPTEILFETELISYDDTDGDMLCLDNKVPDNWTPILDDTLGTMIYTPDGPKFDFAFKGRGLTADENYTLIYYPDPWPGSDLICLGSGTADVNGNVDIAGSVDNGDLPASYDDNADLSSTTQPGKTGAKIWLVLSADVDCDGAETEMTGWNPEEYLFECYLITYEAEEEPGPPKNWCGAAPMYRDGVVNSSLSAADSFSKAFLPLLVALLSLFLWVVVKRRKKD